MGFYRVVKDWTFFGGKLDVLVFVLAYLFVRVFEFEWTVFVNAHHFDPVVCGRELMDLGIKFVIKELNEDRFHFFKIGELLFLSDQHPCQLTAEQIGLIFIWRVVIFHFKLCHDLF